MKKISITVFIFAAVAFVVSACGGAPAAAGWSGAIVVNGVVYAGGVNGKVYAFDATTGEKKWSFPGKQQVCGLTGCSEQDKTVGSIYGKPALDSSGSTLYVTGYDGRLYALDALTGKQEWAFPATGPNDSNATPLPDATPTLTPLGAIVTSPLVMNGVVYFGSDDKTVYAVDANSGQKKAAFHAGDRIWADPVFANNTIYIGSLDHKFYALNANDLSVVWKSDAAGVIVSAAVVGDGVVYFASLNKLYALDTATGAGKWAQPFTADAGNWIWSPLTLTSGTLYFGGLKDTVYAVDAATGKKNWAYPVGSPVRSGLVVANSVVYFGAEDNKVYALDANTGQPSPNWTPFVTKGKILATPTLSGDLLYITSLDRGFYALKIADGSQKWAYDIGNDRSGAPQ